MRQKIQILHLLFNMVKLKVVNVEEEVYFVVPDLVLHHTCHMTHSDI